MNLLSPSSFSELNFQIPVTFSYRLAFTEGVFEVSNPLLADLLGRCSSRLGDSQGDKRVKVILFLDQGLQACQPQLQNQIETYFRYNDRFLSLEVQPVLVPGGEAAKNKKEVFENILQAIHDAGICRHSFVIAVGGGSVLDVVCFAASIVHRGVKQVRIPTTVLAQADAGIGIKNGINAFTKKNFLGAFHPPDAVVNDSRFLHTLDQENWISGIAEAVKVGLIKDREFFYWIQENGVALRGRDLKMMQMLIQRSVELHLKQISQGGDPFEKGSFRPLDFGHWVAHKLESLSNFKIQHGHAVAIGVAVDSIYSCRKGFLPSSQLQMIQNCLEALGFELRQSLLLEKNPKTGKYSILEGIDEFREHLGGHLTVSLLKEIGQSFEVHEIDEEEMMKAIGELLIELSARQILGG